ncbi:hypothetical protein [Bosea sp. BK604]|uniref:hypothetical protein n=1 Tax=Bosea sp. BK604 TaxID=2512180 RepID=UPI00105087E9|nr:hypothetical protein [Bosea sp. BK604]TCR70507.1 hypothetical protein EV560_101914 [Bosea sp. BK604]
MYPKVFLAAAFAIALAAPTTAATIDASPLVLGIKPYLETTLSAVALAAIGFLGRLVQRVFGVQMEKSHRDALHSALMTAAGWGLSMATDLASQKLSKIEVQSAALAEGVNYVTRAVPDAVKFFGLDEAQLQTMLRSKLAQIQFVSSPLVALPPAVPAAA